MSDISVVADTSSFKWIGWDVWVAVAPDLGLMCFGETREEALERLGENWHEWVNALREAGVLHETLDKLGVEWRETS